MNNKNYCYSDDGELYDIMDDNVKTDDEAYQYARKYMKENGGDELNIGTAVWATIDDVIPCDLEESLIDAIYDNVYDNYGGVAGDYISEISKEATKELNETLDKVLKEWIVKNKLEPSFFRAENIVTVHMDGDPNEIP